MSRIRGDFGSGTLSLSMDGVTTTMTSAQLVTLPVVASPDYLILALDPFAVYGAPEKVRVTAHSSAATTATVVRAVEGSTPRAHGGGEAWVWAPTTQDWGLVRNFFSVAEWLVPNDGVADAAVNANLCGAQLNAAGGGVRFWPPGTYLMQSASLVCYSNVVELGCGPGATTIKQGFASLASIDLAGVLVNSDTVNGNTRITLRDLQILATPASGSPINSSTCALFFQGASETVLDNVLAQNGTLKWMPLPAFVNTSNVHSTGKNNGARLSKVRVDSGAQAVYFQQGTDLQIDDDCRFTNCYDSTVSVNSSGERITIGNAVFDKKGNTNPAIAHAEFTNDGAGDAAGIRDVVVDRPVLLNAANASGTHGVALSKVVNAAVTAEVRNNTGHGIFVSNGSAKVVVDAAVVDVPAGGGVGIRIANDGTVGCSDVAVGDCTVVSASTSNNAIDTGGGAQTLTGIAIVGNRVKATVNTAIRMFASVTAGTGLIADNVVGGSSGTVNTGGTTGWVTKNNPGYNPVGNEAPAVPASGVAVAAVDHDRAFYITTAAGATTIAIQGGPTVTLTASAAGQCVRVPAGQTMTPTYANAPTWVVEGE
ncbi:MAG TPA: hypothetical protein VNW96_19195 [Mycobacterium sp.]|nr:hypothetical protein [Mycobacterium sp.]